MPATGFEFASFKVTVTVEVLVPFAVTLVGEATMVDLPDVLVTTPAVPVVKTTATVPTAKFESVVSVAVYVTVWAVVSVTVKVA